MGEFESQPNADVSENSSETTDRAIKAFAQELKNLQQGLLQSWEADIARLQSEKTRLHDDIHRLRSERDSLIGEQHALVRQLGQVLANHISSKLESSLEALFNLAMERVNSQVPPAPPESNPPSNPTMDTTEFLEPLNTAISQALEQIQADLNDYQSHFSQQLAQMQDEQTRGKVILGELVNRLRSELAKTTPPNHGNKIMAEESDEDVPNAEFEEAGIPPFNQFDSSTEVLVESTSELIDDNPTNPTNTEIESTPNSQIETESGLFPRYPQSPLPENQLIPPPSRQKSPPHRPQSDDEPSFPQRLNIRPNLNQSGLLLIALSVIFSALYHVAIKAVFNPRSQILGAFTVEQLVAPNLANCLLILTLRMLVVVPLLLVLAPIMHIRVWQDLQVLFDAFRKPSQRRYQVEANANKRIVTLSAISGAFLFASQASIYFAISQIPVGTAIAIFFAYPIFTGLLAWVLLQESLSRFRFGAIAFICLGNLLVISNLGATSNTGNITLGCLAAVLAGVSFAINVLLSRICAARVHPVSYTLINFSTMLVLALCSWLFSLPFTTGLQTNGIKFLEIILSAFILGVLSLGGYVFNHIGIRKFGPIGSAIAGATVPIFTAIFAVVIIQEQLTAIQFIGILIVTIGAISFNLEKIRHRLRNQKIVH